MSGIVMKEAFSVLNQSYHLKSPSESYLKIRSFIEEEIKPLQIEGKTVYINRKPRNIIEVSMEDYERTIIEGQKIVLQEDLPGVYWMDHDNKTGRPGYLKLAHAKLGTRQGNMCWAIDRLTPKDIVEYFKRLELFLGTPINRSYNLDDNSFDIESYSFNHNEQQNLLNKFMTKDTNGLFSEVNPITIVGEVQKDKKLPILIKTRKIS